MFVRGKTPRTWFCSLSKHKRVSWAQLTVIFKGAFLFGQLSRFLQVGAVGFAVDAGLLWFFVYPMGLPPVLARGLSFIVTIAVTYFLNARYTFKVAPKPSAASRYGLVQTSGALLNFASYTWLVAFAANPLPPLIALVIGSVIGSIHNFLALRLFVFKDTPRSTN